MGNKAWKWADGLKVAALPGMIAALYMALVYAPTERTMGPVQRIFYLHVPLAWVSFLAFFVVFCGGILYLRTRDLRWDGVALSSAEVGVLFCTLMLVTGSIWAKAAWGTWWLWGDPRLTTTLVLWLIYLGYLMLRALSEEERAARVAAVFGIVGFLDVPVVFFSIRWWHSIHGQIITSEGMNLEPEMVRTLWVCLFAFTLLYGCLLFHRIMLERARYLTLRMGKEVL
ncbi:MAG: cytochrome C assembly protein [Candidatus Latescibacterota bacterium]|nr:MAG: cytochrome C assembly protein [Candidatus Latescibacterota bacterium]